MKLTKDVNIYQPKGSRIFYANYRLYAPDTGEVLGQRNKSTGLSNRRAAQQWANKEYEHDLRELFSGREIAIVPKRIVESGVTCGEVIDLYLQNCRQTSVKGVVAEFCVVVAECRGMELKPRQREEFVRSVKVSELSSSEFADWREQNLQGKRTPNNIHAIMRTAKGLFTQAVLHHYRDLSGFRNKYPDNIEEWKKVSKPKRQEGEDQTFQAIDPEKLERMDKQAGKGKPHRSLMLRLSRLHARLGNEADSVRWRNAHAAYWLMRRRGLRNSEVENLRWEWFEVGSSGVKLALIKRLYWNGAKNRVGARVKVKEDLYRELLEVFGPRKEGAEGYLLHGDARDRLDGCNEFVNKFFRHFIDDPWRQKGAYELRKQFGSEIAAKYDLATAARELRDRGLETVYRHYYACLKDVEPL
jgi:hypothetical protein